MVAKVDMLFAKEPDKSIDDITRQHLYIDSIGLKSQQQSIETDHIILDDSLIYKPCRKGEEQTLFVKLLTGTIMPFTFTPAEIVKTFKQKITKAQGIPQEDQRLIFSGIQLEDEETLASYNITHDSTLHLALRLRGGCIMRNVIFTDVSNTYGVRKYEYSNEPVPGRIILPGTNVECNCQCTLGYQVICPKDFGFLELTKATFTCPNCHRYNWTVPITVAFSMCKYRFHGIKATGEQYTSNWIVAADWHNYNRFDVGSQTTWRRLIIESMELHAREECTICLEPMDLATTLACGHRFHHECYAKWNSSCPNCRSTNI